MKAAAENHGRLSTCDSRDFSYLLSEEEKEITDYYCCRSDELWPRIETGIDFAFLDYFSSEKLDQSFCSEELLKLIPLMKQNAIIAIHDTHVKKYSHSRLFQKESTSLDELHLEYLTLPYNYGLSLLRVLSPSPHGTIQDNFIKKIQED